MVSNMISHLTSVMNNKECKKMSSETRNTLGMLTDFMISSRTNFRMHSKMVSRVTSNIASTMGKKLSK